MRHFLFMPALLLLFAACGEKPVGYRIDGNIAGAGDGKVILTTTDDPRGEPATCDTTVMKDGKFTFKGHTPAVRSATLTIVPDGQTAAPGHFFIENSDITVSGDWAGVVEQYGYRSLPLEVTGSRNTDFVNAYNEMLAKAIHDTPSTPASRMNMINFRPRATSRDSAPCAPKWTNTRGRTARPCASNNCG